jgi:hypothetical protein
LYHLKDILYINSAFTKTIAEEKKQMFIEAFNKIILKSKILQHTCKNKTWKIIKGPVSHRNAFINFVTDKL